MSRASKVFVCVMMLIFTCLSPCNAYVPSSSARSSARRRLLASTLSVPLTLLTSPSPSFAGIDVSGLSVEGSQKSDLISQLRPYDGSAATRIQEVKEVNQPPPKPGEGGRAGCERSGRKGVASEARGRSVRSSSSSSCRFAPALRSSLRSSPSLIAASAAQLSPTEVRRVFILVLPASFLPSLPSPLLSSPLLQLPPLTPSSSAPPPLRNPSSPFLNLSPPTPFHGRPKDNLALH